MIYSNVFHNNVQQAVDLLDPGEKLEIDVAGFLQAYPTEGTAYREPINAFLSLQKEAPWEGITCELDAERNVYVIAKPKEAEK